jgi:hypothetical protein
MRRTTTLWLAPISSSCGYQKFVQVVHECMHGPLTRYHKKSIMPLGLLVPSLSRVTGTSSSPAVHPLHTLLDPLLLTTRSTSNKYHYELPQILQDGGGAGEMEETMMWYALNYEKVPDEDSTIVRPNAPDSTEGPWADESWRGSWLERMERRECALSPFL